jgi:zona occludens toxin (predicted ATPase)
MTTTEKPYARWAAAIQTHAKTNYNHGGWDYVVETMDLAEIVEMIKKCRTYEGAFRVVARYVRTLDDHRKDIQGTAF